MQGRSRIVLGIGGFVIVVAMALIVYGSSVSLENHFKGRVADLLPPAPAGWTITPKPIAETPEMQRAVGELLNFDDAVFVDYTSATGDRLSVYIAYWKAGKMSSRLIAGHTPDVCWVGNGWKRNSGRQVNTWGQGRQQIPRAEVREFTIQGQQEHVVFWHLFGGEPISYGVMATPPWYAAIGDMLGKGLHQRQEQFFIRLSAAVPLEEPRLATLAEPLLEHIQALTVQP